MQHFIAPMHIINKYLTDTEDIIGKGLMTISPLIVIFASQYSHLLATRIISRKTIGASND